MDDSLLIDLQSRRLPEAIGQKAANLRLLLDKGYRIPRTAVIPWNAYQRYVANDVSLIEELRTILARHILPDKKYAVRSSASIEDSFDRSFAGQFKTVLNVSGVDSILFAAWSIWATAGAPAVEDYLQRLPGSRKTLDMAVIVQEMVNPVFSGVSFSRNPMTGADEIVVEAVRGSGVQLVQEGTTPHRWIYKWGEWTAKPEDDSIPIAVIQKVVEGTRAIALSLHKTIDLEWVFDGEILYWVQVREITTLRNLNIYSNRISREMLAGQIKPLIWSINIPLVVNQWIRLLDEMVGHTGLHHDQLAHCFHYQIYFNMGILGQIFNKAGLPSEGLEMMMGVVPKDSGRPSIRISRGMLHLLPRLLGFFYDKWYFAGKVERNIPPIVQAIHSIDLNQIPHLGENELVAAICRLYDLMAAMAYYNITAPLLMMMYNGMVSSQLHKLGIPSEQFDLLENMPEIEQYSPDGGLNKLHHQFLDLPPHLQEMIRSGNLTGLQQHETAANFLRALTGFINTFGHLSDNGNDFSVIPWREQPEMILQMISEYSREESHGNKLLGLEDLKSRGLFFNLLYHRARKFRLYREQISSVYTYGYGLFRPYFLALGSHFVQRGLIDCAEDIFYIEWKTIQSAVQQSGQDRHELRQQITQTKMKMENSREINLPSIIYGDDPPPIVSISSQSMRGTPASQGYYCGPARVVHGIEDFHKVMPGDVLVIPFSEVGWTPLFARAGAVVAESGGVLSHSSIIAREYRIPAVVSIPGVMKLRDNQQITVDGFKGEVIIHPEDPNQ